MNFKQTIKNTDFNFRFLQEGTDTVFLVQVENHSFRMIIDDDGNWGIWQQVPAWIKDLEEELASAIDEHYN